MPSVSKEKQINTTKHFGGGVNVSAGATLLIKAGALSLTQIHPRHRPKQLSRKNKTKHKNTLMLTQPLKHTLYLKSGFHLHKQKNG